MGELDLENEPYHRRKITNALKRRGMVIDMEEGPWGLHGPHGPEFNYVVYYGWAVFEDDPSTLVAVSYSDRHGMHEIESQDFSDWWKTDPEQKIPVKARKAEHV